MSTFILYSFSNWFFVGLTKVTWVIFLDSGTIFFNPLSTSWCLYTTPPLKLSVNFLYSWGAIGNSSKFLKGFSIITASKSFVFSNNSFENSPPIFMFLFSYFEKVFSESLSEIKTGSKLGYNSRSPSMLLFTTVFTPLELSFQR